ncbi:T9SS type A sorting domain-containing protein [Paludibacter sp. 221]|uniref:T9SS type A sorting domain-containing protein n=1 Tax=Paludibacter sp. 221 TaxID=2302939 RepID=UPI0013D3EA15|nr:T9SS type A sorting domain-containing protein [Paludibacter sp. 221]
MKKNFLIVFCLLITNVFIAFSQPNLTNIPTPITYFPTGTNPYLIYGTEGNNATPKNNYSTSISTYTGGFKATPTAENYCGFFLELNALKDVSTQRYLYFMSYNFRGSYLRVTTDTGNTATVTLDNKSKSYQIVGSDWTLIEVDFSASSITNIKRLAFQTYNNLTPTYIANVYLSDKPYADPTIPQAKAIDPPVRPAGTYLSIYNDLPYAANAVTKIVKYGNGNISELKFSSTENFVKTIVPAAASSEIDGVEFTCSETSINSYTTIYFDIFPTENFAAGDVYIRLESANNGGRYIKTSLPELTAKTWNTVKIKLSDFAPGWNGINPTDVMSKFYAVRFATPKSVITEKTFSIDNLHFYKDLSPQVPATPEHTGRTSIFVDGDSNLSGDFSGTTTDAIEGNNYLRITNLQNGASFTLDYPADIQENMLHLDVWVENSQNTKLTLTLENEAEDSGSATISASQLQSGVWNKINILVSDFDVPIDGAIWGELFTKLIFSGSDHAIYVDNIYFYQADIPTTTVAPAPAQTNPDRVLRVYRDNFEAAAQAPGTGFGSLFSQEQTYTRTTTTDKYRVLSGMSQYAKIDFGDGFSLADWPFLHIHARVNNANANLNIKIDGVSGATTSSQPLDASEEWQSITLSTETLGAPAEALVKGLSIASDNGFVFIDNVYFYKSVSDQQPTTTINVAGSNGADGNYPSIYQAIDKIISTNQDGKTITVTVNGNSIEDRKIKIQEGSNTNWTKLTIKPGTNAPAEGYTISFSPLASLDQTYLFEFFGAKNITIDGALDGRRALTFKGFYNLDVSTWTYGTSNSIIHFTIGLQSEDIVIQNCIFTNDTDNRSISAISGYSVQNLTIQNNEFRNCLSTKGMAEESAIGVIDFRAGSSSIYNNINILGNYFYETEPVKFESFYTRLFISVSTSTLTSFTAKINDNKIGGIGFDANGNFINGNLTFNSSGTSTHLGGIRYVADAESATNTLNIEVKGNTIANFDCINNTTINSISGKPDVACFTGIEVANCEMDVSNNIVENIKWKTTATSISSATTLTGIYCRVYKNTKTTIKCNNNKMKDLVLDVANGISTLKVYWNGIKIQTETINDKIGLVECSGNHIIWDLNVPDLVFATNSELSAFHIMDARGYMPLNLFNNIAVLKACNLGINTTVTSLYRIQLDYALGNDTPVANIYNNIAYTQGAASGFAGQTRAKGMYVVYSNQGVNSKVNFYHNTIFVNNAGTAARAVNYQVAKDENSENSKLYSWNNNIVNLGADYLLGLGGPTDFKNILVTDYNNYYSPRTANYFAYGWNNAEYRSSTFDDWKFNNTFWLIPNKGEQDFHSSFVNPKFGGTDANSISIPFTYDGVESLKSLLKPNAFIAGKEFSNMPVDIAGATRRSTLPTAGATEAITLNYWRGTTSSDWGTASNWTANEVPENGEDIIFATDAQRDLVLDKDRTVRDIYNDTGRALIVDGKKLTISGLVRMDNTGKIDATKASHESSSIYYYPEGSTGAIVQHIYKNTYKNDEIANLTLKNQTNYFVLLYDKLNISKNFATEQGTGNKGVLNCYHYNTELTLSNTEEQEIPRYSIYNDSVYNLVINSPKVVTNQDNLYVKNNLTIGADNSLEIPITKLVKVYGATTNANGIAGLLIKADPNHVQPAGSFIFRKGDVVEGTVEFHVKASNPIETPKEADKFQWQYFGSPVESYNAKNFQSMYIREFNEGVNTGFWTSLTNDDDLKAFIGYEISRYADKNASFNITGQLVNRDKEITLGKTSGTDYSGQYIFSNPYTAALPINDAMFKAGTNIEQTIYLFNTGTLGDWEDNQSNQEGTGKGQFIAIPLKQAGTVVGLTSIPSMQGFIVRTNSGDAGNTFNFVYDVDSVVKNTHPMRSKAQDAAKPVFTKISLSSESKAKDLLWLVTDENSNYGFDNGYDGYKMTSSAQKSLLCAVGEDGIYQVSTIPDINGTYLYFKAEEGVREYTLTFDHNNMEQNYGTLYLLDLKTNEQVEITATNSTYNFIADNETTPEIRFQIMSERNNEDDVKVSSEEIQTYQLNSYVFIKNGYDNNGKFYLYDISGKLIYKQNISALSTSFISENALESGVYLLKVQVENEDTFSTKIVIK